MRARVATEAPIKPVEGARTTPTTVMATARLPGTRRRSTCRQSSNSRAIPLFSSATLMKRSIGTAG
jgi:hypothetical protein